MNLRHLLGIAALTVLIAGLVASGAAVDGVDGQVTADGESVENVTVEAGSVVEEPGLFSLQTLGAVALAVAVALLVVAAVRHADR